jgi:hypothetical protein
VTTEFDDEMGIKRTSHYHPGKKYVGIFLQDMTGQIGKMASGFFGTKPPWIVMFPRIRSM